MNDIFGMDAFFFVHARGTKLQYGCRWLLPGRNEAAHGARGTGHPTQQKQTASPIMGRGLPLAYLYIPERRAQVDLRAATTLSLLNTLLCSVNSNFKRISHS